MTEKRVAAHWGNPPYIDRYGAAWTLANAGVLWPFRNTPVETQTRVLRIFSALSALACSLLFWLALARFKWRPAALVAFALNPLVILETGNGAHNDIYLVLLGLAAYLLAERKRYVLSGFVLGVSVSTKFAYAPLILPLAAVTFFMTKSFLRTALTCAGSGATIILLSLPFTMRLSLLDPAINASHMPMNAYILWRIFQHLGFTHVTQQEVVPMFGEIRLAA